MKINVTELLIDTGAAELREGPNFKVKIWQILFCFCGKSMVSVNLTEGVQLTNPTPDEVANAIYALHFKPWYSK